VVLRLAQGQTSSISAATATSTGTAKRSTGRTKRAIDTPLLNQTAISLSRYMRVSTDTTATNSDRLSIVGSCASAM